MYERETQLRFLLGLAPTDGRLIRPIDEPTMARIEFDWHQIRAEGLFRSPELRQQKWLIKQRELELISARNQLLPQLDVGAVYRWVGVGDELMRANETGVRFPNPGSTAYEELASGKFQEAAFFFNFQLPVGFRSELSGVRNAQLQLARERAVLEDRELNTVHLLSSAIRTLDSSFTSAQTHFNRWSASEKEVESAQALYTGGKTTLNRVLDAQQRRAQAQFDFYTALCNYSKAIANVHFRKGSLLEYNTIHLAEGPWPHKAYWDALAQARERDASYYLDYGWSRPNVVSRGAVPQHGVTVPGEPIMSIEQIPSRQPAPVQAAPADHNQGGGQMDQLPAPAPQPAPITELPTFPELDGPVIRTSHVEPSAAQVSNPLRDSFDWSAAGEMSEQGIPSSPLRPSSNVTNVSDTD